VGSVLGVRLAARPFWPDTAPGDAGVEPSARWPKLPRGWTTRPSTRSPAQVIPVLFLALVFETRLLRSYADEPFANSVVFIGVFGAMLVGEVAALAALNGTAPSRLEKNMVWLALIVGVPLVLGWPIWSRVGRVLGHSLLKRGGSASR
jgi:hypothetical protein